MTTEPRPFIHLHCHSHYSLLDGASSIDRLVGKAKEHGMNALALTDHGNLHGALEFYNKCKAQDINPIIGYEAYIAPGSRFDKHGKQRDSNYHLTLLCQNKTGFDNLVKMASKAALEGFYFKPRIDKELLEAHSEGIICLSGCVSSEFNRSILKGTAENKEHYERAAEVAQWFQKVFGNRYFIEIMNNGVDIQKVALEGSVDIANKLGMPLVATSDCHYVEKDDWAAQDVMLCISTGRYRADANRMKMDGQEYFLRSQEEMYDKFPGLDDAVARSQEIANTVDINIDLNQRHFPVFFPPDEKTPDEYLRELCIQGLEERYEGNEEMLPGGKLSDVVMARLDRELGVISKLGFPNYFLIVWDFVLHGRAKGIPATARGSGVGAIVCYALYMSHVCPIKYDLLFERFLDENRIEAPDIDIDFCKERRGEVIRYVKDTYGEENVAQIGTFGTLAARAAIKDVGRTLGIPLGRVNEITGMVPDEMKITLKKALDSSADLRNAYDSDPDVKEMLDFAQKIEGLCRNIGTHAAAVVISDKPLEQYVPLTKVPGKDDVITQWSMNDVEAAGLLKMDFLGLRNLTILRIVVDLIEETTGKTIDPLKFPLDDEPTYGLLQRGETKGVFQLESGGIRDLLTKMKPDQFTDIIATNALYRPGPLEGGMVQQFIDVKHGRIEAEYPHPILEEILAETNGVMVYQEQVMRILNRLGGIELSASYKVIKAISKKKEKIIAANHGQFIKGCVEKGMKKNESEDFWQMILKFAGYGFNKSHSTAYALIAYQTAYLKTHYPIEFMAALLTGDIPGRNFTKKDSLVEHIEDCQRMEVELIPPSVNQPSIEFGVHEGKIVFGLSAVKGCGGSAAESIVREFEKDGPFKDLFDFCERVPVQECGKASLESLLKSGAFDCFGAKRSQIESVMDRAVQGGQAAAKDRKSGQMNLFGGPAADDEQAEDEKVELPEMDEWVEKDRLAAEKEVLGYYLSSHPLAEYMPQLKQFCSHTTATLDGVKDREEVILGGMIAALRLANVKKVREEGAPTRYAMFDLEDIDGAIRSIMWPTDFATGGEMIQADAIVVIRGVLDRRGGDEANLIVNQVIPIDGLDDKFTIAARLHIDEEKHGLDGITNAYEVVRAYPGNLPLELMVRLQDGRIVKGKSNKLKVKRSDEMKERTDSLLGPGFLQFLIDKPKPTKAQSGGKKYGRG